jgi:hypothetical protein
MMIDDDSATAGRRGKDLDDQAISERRFGW